MLMKVDKCHEDQQQSCPREPVNHIHLAMDDHGSHRSPHRQSGMRVSTKSKAPSPPVRSPGLQSFPGYPHLTMDRKDTLVEEDVSLLVVLPGGVEQMTTVHGSKPLMDLLVMLCAKYHLNPSSHTLELVTANRNHIKFKPNALIGTLEAERVMLKPKGMEDKNKKTGPQMPEATVRMVINYKNSQKTILRVNPRVPLADLLPAICVKCEFDVETTVLLREIQSQGPLDLSNSLNDYAIREVYARDMKDQPASPVCSTSPTPSGLVTPGKDKIQKEKENKGLFSKFRRSKKQSEQATTASAPASPVLVSKPRPLSMALPSSSPFVSPTTPTDVPKKRRAPQPPMVVSQSCPSDLCIRQRLCSEPDATLDADQISGLSRGSSAESSLRRTKRKAPPPPVSPSTVVQDPLYLDEGSQGDAATNTLEEIKELEEISASVTSGAAGDTVGDDGSLNLSADISQDSPSQDTDKLSQASVEGTGGRWPGDLSAHGKSMASTVDNSVLHKQAMHAPEVNSSEVEHSESSLHQVDEDGMQSACEGSAMASEAVVSPIPFRCETREAETQASVQASAEAPCEESLVVSSKPGPTGEDAQVQTDLTAIPVPSQQHADNVACLLTAPATGSLIQKRDMATFTEELCNSGLRPALETPSRQTSAPSASVITQAASTYAAGSEPKPKPSNELTRDYCPKVGMTTYTIVPQKSLEKLRYFEVELTLESPAVAPVKQKDIVSLELRDGASLRGQTVLTTSRENTPMSYSSASTHSTVDRRLMELAHSPSPLMEAVHVPSPTGLPAADENNLGFQTGSMADVKEMKIPPATKPKPGSFRMAQHKRTPGYYVTSAAVRSPHASPAAGQKEVPCSLERLPPPPLPPPVECLEEAVGGSNVELSPRSDDIKTLPILTPLTRQSSKEPALGLSLDKLRSFAAPRPYSPATPSRFAQAVSSAVRRSQSVSHSPVSPRSPVSPPFSPIGGRFSVKRLAKPKESDNREVGAENVIRHEKVPEPSPTRGDSCSPPQCLNECENKSLYCKKNEDPAICFSSSPAPVSPKI